MAEKITGAEDPPALGYSKAASVAIPPVRRIENSKTLEISMPASNAANHRVGTRYRGELSTR
jgi:hypothetical protein